MTQFDPSQMRVLELDPERHARILGAPGTGKTRVLVEAFRRAWQLPGWDEQDVLVLAPNRLVAAGLRPELERALGQAFGGTPVRTAASLGFAVLSRVSALAGENAPRLLTGTVQDEAIAQTIAALLESGADETAGLVPEVLQSPTFRAELRELWRVSDDFGVVPGQLRDELAGLLAQSRHESHTRLPEVEIVDRWRLSLGIIERVAAELELVRPNELSSSALLSAAAAVVRREGTIGEGSLRIPRLILVDDAQELGEGQLALLAGCARAGSSVWVFGDPDLATGAFTGERSRVMARLHDELARRDGLPGSAGLSGPAGSERPPEQVAVLSTVYRHGPELRGFLRGLTSRIGAAGVLEHRAAEAVPGSAKAEVTAGAEPVPGSSVQFATASSPAEQLGIIAHRLRARRLGLGGSQPIEWSDMAVICRTRGEASRIARLLAVHQVPTGVAAGGVVLREHQIVRELIRLLQHTLGIHPLGAEDVLQLVGGVIGGLDPVAIRRLRGALLMQERRTARQEERPPQSIETVIAEGFAFPSTEPIVDSAGGRALRRLGMIAAAAGKVEASEGTARETLWAIWEGTGLASRWQSEALEGRGARADEAHRSLDAVLGLFFALQRHEEQDSEQAIAELLEELLLSAVPEDSLAQQSQREVVTVTTPQGVIGREFEVVAVVGAQDGSWPNLRARGSLLGATALERWLRGGEATAPSRRDTIHDELRLFVHSCARARDALLVVAVTDEDQHPSAFFGFGREHLVSDLPSARLTLRGATSEMRRRVTVDPGDTSALRSLLALAEEGIAGAHPDEWYGVTEPSTTAPIVDLLADPEASVSVSPSQLERAEECPLDWVVASLGGGGGSVQASLGTLIHHALETAQDADAAKLLQTVLAEWHKLPFDADWESQRTKRVAEQMTEGLAEYLRDFEGSDRELLAREGAFEIPLEHAVLRGFADRLEVRRSGDGPAERAPEITVVDLKTGRTPPSAAATATHAQLQAYQLGVMLGAFESAAGLDGARSGGARLLYVHPDATKRGGYVERGQEPMSEEAKEELIGRVAAIAHVMAANEFTARVEHHCSDPHKPGNCRLHIIQAVSHA